MSNRNGARNGDGRHAAGGGAARRRNTLIVAAIVLGLLAFGGGYLLARNQGGSSPSPSAAVSRSPKPTKDPSVTPSASASGSVSPSASASASVTPSLEDGRHFVFLEEADVDGGWSLRFDLAYFYTDQDAVDACGQDLPNGYCIVNDNPKIRTLPVSAAAAVRYIPTDECCALQPGTFPALAAAVDGTSQGEYEPTAPYWITVSGGQIVRIAQQFLP